MRLITPKRLKDNEAFMWRLADQQLDEFVADGHCEFISAYAQPFAMLVVADLLGVPEADHQRFREGFGLRGSAGRGRRRRRRATSELNPLGWLDDWFADYIEDRRREPRQDVLTDLALATYPDGTTPDVIVGRAHGDVPVRRRSGDDRPPARRRAASTSPSTRAAGRAARATASSSRTSSRRCCASRAR